jgi:hypothetical protein
MDINLVNQIILDFPNKGILSDGVFTFGQLHRDRLSLYINLIDLLSTLYEAKGVEEVLWISMKDHEGKSQDGYMHLGLFAGDKSLEMGALVPEEMWEIYNAKATIMQEAPKYIELVNALPNYFYEKLSVPSTN